MNQLSRLSVLCLVGLFLAMGCSSSDPVDDEAPAEPMPEYDDAEEHDHHDHDHDEHAQDDQGVLHMVAVAEVFSGDGEKLGEVMFNQLEEGVEIHGRIEGLEPGPKGFHVHEHEVCDPPDFESAGGHFNPEGHPHGHPDDPSDHRHAGDFGNIEFDEDGVAEFAFVDPVITLGSGVNDVVGKALIVHYQEDDGETQPTGDAGPRAGCGIITASGDAE